MILGTVNLLYCVRGGADLWADPGDLWHWLLANRKPWPEPVPARGDLGLWDWPRD